MGDGSLGCCCASHSANATPCEFEGNSNPETPTIARCCRTHRTDGATMPKSMNIRDLRIENAQLKAENERLVTAVKAAYLSVHAALVGGLSVAGKSVSEAEEILRAAIDSTGADRRSAGAEERGG